MSFGSRSHSTYWKMLISTMCWTLIILIPTSSAFRYRDYYLSSANYRGLVMVLDGAADPNKIVKSLADMVEIVKKVKENKSKEVKDILTAGTCDVKMQWRDCVSSNDISGIFGVKQSSVYSMVLASMIDCPHAQVHASRFIFTISYFPTKRLRDISEVLVTVSDTPGLHDNFIKDLQVDTGSGSYSLHRILESGVAGIKGDIENLLFELKDRKRESGPKDVKEGAEDLKKEMDDWDSERGNLDDTMINRPLANAREIADEFKNINDGVSLDDCFTKEFEKDIHKLTTYRQLLQFVRDKIVYMVDEIRTRIDDNDEYSLPIANALAWMGTLSKEDRDKLEVEYKKKHNIGLIEHLEELTTTTGLEDVTTQVIKSFIEDLKKRPT